LTPLISIIIPTYNRAHLIEETLNSILSQTYQHWECIIVDDGSTDATSQVVGNYVSDKSRFSYHNRPLEKPKGANSCRNYGYEKSNGDYIIWFDSDDLMLPLLLECMLDQLVLSQSNYSVSRYSMFVENNLQEINEPLFDMNRKNELTGRNYMVGKSFWGTINVMLHREMVKEIRFDESLNSGQEYNFFTRLFVPNNSKGVFIDEVLCKRRIHQQSIQYSQNQNNISYLKNKYQLYLITHKQLSLNTSPDHLNYLLIQAMSFAYRLNEKHIKIPSKRSFFDQIKIQKGKTKLLLFQLSLELQRHFKIGYRMYKKSIS
jgi:glycosyltransferase involved in cell wall biosynthesis